ncbi:MAG TPA: hypothetical protein VF624_07195, partial [Tepidisphaeraceae bacterium]
MEAECPFSATTGHSFPQQTRQDPAARQSADKQHPRHIILAGTVRPNAPSGKRGRLGAPHARARKPESPFRYFNSSPEVIRLVVLMYVRFPLSLRNVEDLLFERGIDICHETVPMWWNRFGPMFAGDIRRQRVSRMRGFRHWRWH